MNTQKHHTWSRRQFLRGLTIAGGAGLLGLRPELAAAEPPPETTTIRLPSTPGYEALCFSPQFVAEQFLGMEGFTDVRYVPDNPDSRYFGENSDIFGCFGVEWINAIDRGEPIVILAGSHVGCMEIVVNDRIRSIREFKNKRIAVSGLGGGTHAFLSTVVANIGLDAQRDIEWVDSNRKDWARMLTEGEVDALGAVPPQSYEFRKIGRVMVNTTTDEPWRYYFCCMIAAKRAYVENYPIATKRALRAILKANQLCSLEPQRTAQWLVDKGFAFTYDYALQTLQDLPYSAWRDYDPEDSVRFYSLRLREAGFIKSAPQEIIARGTDWRFLNELRKELKA